MKILLTNDDGIYAEGLLALYDRFMGKNSVTVVAPDRERSAAGHGITLHTPLCATPVAIRGRHMGHAVNGTPVDCVNLAMAEILDGKPDVVISGINSGPNVGNNINYSGTVSAAKEAALHGIPAIAASIQMGPQTDYRAAAGFLEKLAQKVVENGLPLGTLLNVNLPNMSLKSATAVRISRQGIALLPEYYEKRPDPRNRIYCGLGGEYPGPEGNPEVDEVVLCQNFISITPLQCDMTDYRFMGALKGWNLNAGG
ncbi:MAG: 5'/3'-nucleotidase SurE [Desulfobacterales bacterium]|nr:5'/3'-nucleotidase SurE [Desulfobacterales bacterium]